MLKVTKWGSCKDCATCRRMKTERCETHSDAGLNPGRGLQARRSCRLPSGSGWATDFSATAWPLNSPLPSSPSQNRISGPITSRPGRSTIRIATSFGTTSSSERSLGPSPGGSVIGRFPFWPDSLRARMNPKPRVMGRSYARSRGALATSLMQLVETARLNVLSPEGKAPGIAEQYEAIRLATRDVQIDAAVRLSDYL
jgi:hypothetical protein